MRGFFAYIGPYVVAGAIIWSGGCTRSEHSGRPLSHTSAEDAIHSAREHLYSGQTQSELAIPRKNFHYSVIPGGAYSAEELRSARAVDSVVAAHYSGFGAAPVIARLPNSVDVYVSYRVGDKVYWTTRKHRIPQGEAVLSDGAHLARARCGNRLSTLPQAPSLISQEPGPGAFGQFESPSDAKSISFPKTGVATVESIRVLSGDQGEQPAPGLIAAMSRNFRLPDQPWVTPTVTAPYGASGHPPIGFYFPMAYGNLPRSPSGPGQGTGPGSGTGTSTGTGTGAGTGSGPGTGTSGTPGIPVVPITSLDEPFTLPLSALGVLAIWAAGWVRVRRERQKVQKS